jgi:hypothetical protein
MGRITFGVPDVLEEQLRAMSKRSGVPLRVLLTQQCEALVRDGASVRIPPASVVPAKHTSALAPHTAVLPATPQRVLSRPQYGDETTQAPPEDDDEDTQQCPDCGEVVPMSHYTPGMEHKNCTMPGAGIVALRRLATEQPPE